MPTNFVPDHHQYCLPAIGYCLLTMAYHLSTMGHCLPTMAHGLATLGYRLPTIGYLDHLCSPIHARWSQHQSHQPRERARKQMGVTWKGCFWTWPSVDMRLKPAIPPRMRPVLFHPGQAWQSPERLRQHHQEKGMVQHLQPPPRLRLEPHHHLPLGKSPVRPSRCVLIPSQRASQSRSSLPLPAAKVAFPMLKILRIYNRCIASYNGLALTLTPRACWTMRQR